MLANKIKSIYDQEAAKTITQGAAKAGSIEQFLQGFTIAQPTGKAAQVFTKKEREAIAEGKYNAKALKFLTGKAADTKALKEFDKANAAERVQYIQQKNRILSIPTERIDKANAEQTFSELVKVKDLKTQAQAAKASTKENLKLQDQAQTNLQEAERQFKKAKTQQARQQARQQINQAKKELKAANETLQKAQKNAIKAANAENTQQEDAVKLFFEQRKRLTDAVANAKTKKDKAAAQKRLDKFLSKFNQNPNLIKQTDTFAGWELPQLADATNTIAATFQALSGISLATVSYIIVAENDINTQGLPTPANATPSEVSLAIGGLSVIDWAKAAPTFYALNEGKPYFTAYSAIDYNRAELTTFITLQAYVRPKKQRTSAKTNQKRKK